MLGIPVGLAADAWLGGVMDQFFPLPVVRDELPGGRLPAGSSARAGAAAARGGLARVAGVRVDPIEAIRVGARAARSSGLAWLVKGLRLPGGSLANLPLRNVLRTPRRTLMTLLGIGAVVTIVIAHRRHDGLLRPHACRPVARRRWRARTTG